MRRSHPSLAGLSILFALGLAVWEAYFFWYAGSFPQLEGRLGWFTPDRLGFNMAWLASLYLTYQLISIPFSLPVTANRFIGVVDGMASLVPLAVVLVVAFGKPHLLSTPHDGCHSDNARLAGKPLFARRRRNGHGARVHALIPHDFGLFRGHN